MAIGQEKKLIINKEFNPIILGQIISRHWFLPFVIMAIFAGIAFLYLRYTKPIYQSSAVLQLVEEDKMKQALGDKALGVVNQGADLNKTIEFLRSEFLFEKALNTLNTEVSIFSEGKLLSKDLYKSSNFRITLIKLLDSSLCGQRIDIQFPSSNTNLLELHYSKNGTQKIARGILNGKIKNNDFEIEIRGSKSEFNEILNSNKLYFTVNKKQVLKKEWMSKLTVMPVDPTAKTLQITFDHYNPILCRDIVQSLISAFFKYEEQVGKQNNEKVIGFVEEQLDSLSRVLKSARDSVTNFQRREKITDPKTESESVSEKMNDLKRKLLEFEEELVTVYLIKGKISQDPDKVDVYKLIPEMIGKKSFEGSLIRQIEDLNKLLEKRDDLLDDVTEEHGEYKKNKKKIELRQASLKKSVLVIEERIKGDVDLIQDKLKELEERYFDLPEKTLNFDRLKYIEELNNRYFTLFTEKKIEFALSNAGYSSTNRILTAPILPETPLSPNSKLIYIIAMVFGAFLGIALMVFFYLRYNEIVGPEDLIKMLPEGTNFLGSVPLYRRKMKYSQVVVTESSKSRMAEAIRSIRANMSFINKDARVIAISSSVSGEGKTFVALNLAGMIAVSGKRTLVIDLDMRKPKVHHGFSAENLVGMSNLLSRNSSYEDVVQHSLLPGLDFITAGPIPPNPSELILSIEFEEFLEDMKSRYDIVMIDNPPVGIVSDGIQILANADIPIYVFKSNYSKRVFVNRVEELFSVQKLKSLNIILNGIETKKSIYSYAYGYGYGYGYGNSYGYGSGYYSDDDDDSPLLNRIIKKLKNLVWKSKKKK
jgi:capsular exopolysaccharide synthesis family protein